MEPYLPHPISSKVPAWFERKFNFAFPVQQYPNVLVRLWGTAARLEEILRNVTREVLVGKPQEKWSGDANSRLPNVCRSLPRLFPRNHACFEA